MGHRRVPVLSIEQPQAWDRIHKETDPAWDSFVVFRDYGPKLRTVQLIAQDCGKSLAIVRGWSRKYRWFDRVAAWDIHIDRIHQKAYEEETKLMGERHARMAMEMQALGKKRIGQFVESDVLQAELTARDAIALVDTGVKIEREARAVDKSKGEEKAGNITFNITMPGGRLPAWAPKNLQIAEAEVVQENGTDSRTKEEAPRPAAEGD